MFGNRKRRTGSTSSFNSITTNTSSSAALAASQAFISNSQSSSSLAAAAAGAALRSRPTTPISVADVQTKRTQRRGSISSVTSGTSGFVRPSSQLQRSGSSGSMTERTFRSPSPNGRRTPVPAAVDAPPVPAVPKNLGRIRAASVEAPPVRVTSPTPRANGRGSSMGPTSTFASRNTGQRSSTLQSVSELGSLQRTDSAGSVNFSYPRGNRAMSPYGGRALTSPTPSSISQRVMSPTPKAQMVYDPNTRTMRPESEVYTPSRVASPSSQPKLVYDANTRSFRPEAEVLFLQQELLEASQAPVSMRAKPQSSAGSYLSKGSTTNYRPTGTFVDAQNAVRATPPRVLSPPPTVGNSASLPSRISEEPESPSPVAQKKTKKRADLTSDRSNGNNDSDGYEASSYSTRPAAMLVKRPSTIREGDEEEDPAINATRRATLQRLESSEDVPTDRAMSPSPRTSTTRITPVASPAVPSFKKTLRANSQPPTQSTTPTVKGARIASVSPSRKARFSLTPTTNNSLTVRHDPPGRSISPRKSALKHANSPRGTSPAVTPSTVYATPDQTPADHDNSAFSTDPTPTRKKSVRVSFDDDVPVVLGNAAESDTSGSPMVASPQHKKWFGLGRKQKDDSDDKEEKMAPRAALPSFASVRERQTSGSMPQEDRPLRTPAGTNTNALVAATTASASAVANVPAAPLFTAANSESKSYDTGTSNDHGPGALFAQKAANEQAIHDLNTSSASKTDALTNGDLRSDTSSVYDDQQTGSNDVITENHDVHAESADGHAESYRALASDDHGSGSATLSASTLGLLAGMGLPPVKQTDQASPPDNNAPTLALTEPTPLLESKEFDLASDTPQSQAKTVTTLEYDEASGGYIHVPKPVHEASESEEEHYANAQEDLSAVQGDGYMSLNAIAASPVKPVVRSGPSETGTDSPTPRDVKERVYQQAMMRQPSEPDLDAGWAKAQQYWSGLSQDRKRELELQALTDGHKNGVAEEAEDSDADMFTSSPKIAPYTKTIVNVEPPVILPPSPKKTNPVNFEVPRPAVINKISDERTYQVKPGQKALSSYGEAAAPKMRSSLRSGSVGANDNKGSTRDESIERRGMRMSMRGPAPVEKRSARIAPQTIETAQEKHDREVQDHVRTLSVASAAIAKRTSTPAIMPSLQRKGSDASDSSFKRKRSGGGGFKKGSMRNPSVTRGDDVEERPDSSRFSVRTLSPNGSLFRKPFGATNRDIAAMNGAADSSTPAMPRSLRNRASSSDSRTTTLQSLNGNRRAQSTDRAFGGGFAGRKSAAKSSRFTDDSDEDTPGPKLASAFRSRFGDSSDEEDAPARASKPPRMTTMRAQASHSQAAARPSAHSRQASNVSTTSTISSVNGIMSTIGKSSSRQSTDNSEMVGKLDRSGSGRDTIGQMPSSLRRAESPTPKGNKRRGSIISVFRRKKVDDEHRVTKSKAESPARRDTQLERTPAELAVLRSNDVMINDRPKLQKRNTGSRGGSQYGSYAGRTTSANGNVNNAAGKDMLGSGSDWPLNGKLTEEHDRPYTADDVNNDPTQRPLGVARRYTNDSTNNLTPRKKKKFGMLRRIMGLDV